MSYVNLFKQMTRSRLTIVVGVLLSGLLVFPLIDMFQDLDEPGIGSVPASEWNAERVLAEFQQLMSVTKQHERVATLLPRTTGEHIWKSEVMLPIGANLRKQFKILMADVEKAQKI